ncbi:probable N-lysine methyltransferase SETD6 at N-terminal half [Coccomyxa sp. Obi]|nr:probable N-lysine methyltransferase SETD6 at N-terminal half [Coccomyxa sp. Obi]
MYELSIGRKSFWHGYLKELQQREYLPLFWDEEEISLLKGTEAEHRPQEDAELTQEDFDTNVLPLLRQHPDRLATDAFTLEAFRTAASWVASRAFGVDSFHGMSMVPLADIFNHKAAIVQLSDDYVIEPNCFAEDSSEDGSSLASDGEASDDERQIDELVSADQNGYKEAGGRRTDDDKPATATTRGSMLKLSGGDLDQYRLEIGICGATRSDGEEVLEIIAASPVQKGHEVHNTYGELGNAELVVKYGFALRNNPFDVVLLDKAAVVEEARRMLGDRACRQRCRFLSRESELLDEDREPFEVLPSACIAPSLLVALRVLLATKAEFHSWRTLDDALHLCATQQKPSPLAVGDSAACSNDSCNVQQEQLRAPQQPEDGSKPSTSRKRDVLHRTGDSHDGAGAKKQRSGTARTDGVGGAPETGSLSGVTGAQHNGSCREDISDREQTVETQQLQIANTSIEAAPSEALTADMCTALRHCIQQRLQRYRHAGLEQDLQELEAEEKLSQQSASRSEHHRARLAALRLVVGEKEVLHAALEAIALRMQ